ncbi:MAG: integrase core domain-containing protein, partial [Oxalobacter sp.]|nr:integrase core domain-containing protein [Oxalobacter sp.]
LGSQYSSNEFQELLHSYQMVPSMSHKGACWDNAVVESFWASLKRDVLPGNGRFKTREEAVVRIRQWMLFYNNQRPHSSLGNIPPKEYQKRCKYWDG